MEGQADGERLYADDKSFGSLLGISYYLGKDEFRGLQTALSGILCDGSAICLDYPSSEDSRETRINRALTQGAGERMKAQYAERELEAPLEACGFLIYEHLGHREMTDRYFSDHNRRCPAHRMELPEGVRYVCAARKRE